MAKIYQFDPFYYMLRPYVDYCTRSSYSRTMVCGEENIPTDGAVIIAPNHTNTLLDALVVLRARRRSTVFGARADIFKKYGKILTFLKMVPMVRVRDGLREVEKNRETNGQLVEVLENGVPFCIFSEGKHRPKRSLLPITKGVVRLALEANESFGERKPVYIVPAGIEYGDFFRFRSSSLLQYGKAINVTEFVREHTEMNEAQIQMALRAEIAKGISNLITYFEDDEQFDPKWAIFRILTAGRKGDLVRKLESNKAAAAKVEALFEQKPEEMAALAQKAEAFHEERKKEHISMRSFRGTPLVISALWKLVAAIIGLPFFLLAGLTSLPLWIFAELLCSKVKDKAFHNTMHFASKLIFTPLIIILWAGLTFGLLPGIISHSSLGFACPALAWVIPTLLTAFVPFGYGIFYDYIEFLRIWFSDVRLSFNARLKKQYKEILSEIR